MPLSLQKMSEHTMQLYRHERRAKRKFAQKRTTLILKIIVSQFHLSCLSEVIGKVSHLALACMKLFPTFSLNTTLIEAYIHISI